ncbi:MAG: divergent PAP2 family protein [Nanoarchaeota archaeon]|nr:divergent PAP2 family protein [Nanoarchaeota archaeon]MBU1854705.1 divergent PAP2 family protein [Nanoarchaeota archaeon]
MIGKIVLSILIAFIVAQTLKLIFNRLQKGKWEYSTLVQDGGMPSSHTSVVVALTISILLETGLSYYFAICVILALIVMNDAMKVRRETGEEAEVLNELIQKENIFHTRLITKVGHTPLQVAMGLINGTLITLIVYAF